MSTNRALGRVHVPWKTTNQVTSRHTYSDCWNKNGRWVGGNSYGQMSLTDSTKYSRQTYKPCLSEIRSATTSPENNYGNLNVAFVDGH